MRDNGVDIGDIYTMLCRCKNLTMLNFIDCPHGNDEIMGWFCSQLKLLTQKVDIFVYGGMRIQQFLYITQQVRQKLRLH
jgi:hypothetical protein